jgi:hypothetical protein
MAGPRLSRRCRHNARSDAARVISEWLLLTALVWSICELRHIRRRPLGLNFASHLAMTREGDDCRDFWIDEIKSGRGTEREVKAAVKRAVLVKPHAMKVADRRALLAPTADCPVRDTVLPRRPLYRCQFGQNVLEEEFARLGLSTRAGDAGFGGGAAGTRMPSRSGTTHHSRRC